MKEKYLKITEGAGFYLLLFAAAFAARMPALFNDYYDVDELAAIVQTWDYFSGALPGIDFIESKHFLYHLIFKFSYLLFPSYGWSAVHFITILIVFFTGIFIFKCGIILRDRRSGELAALIYVLFISSFNRQFMATNAEVVFNLPVAAGLYFLIAGLNTEGRKKAVLYAASFLAGIAAAGVKFHGIIFIVFLILFFFFYLPYYKRKITSRYVIVVCVLFSLILLAASADYFHFRTLSPLLIKNISKKFYYVINKSGDPLYYIMKFLHVHFMLVIWHAALWVPALFSTAYFVKNGFRAKTPAISSLALLMFMIYAMILAGGARLYFHYFMALYPPFALAASLSLAENGSRPLAFIRKKIVFFVLFPAVFFLAWNLKDIAIRHFYPEAFYSEGKFLYWTRAVLTGAYNDYLLPHASYKDVCGYIKENTGENDRIFVWGDGAYLYYFSGRMPGVRHMWPRNRILMINRLYSEGSEESLRQAREGEKIFLKDLSDKKPELFIDTSESGYNNFDYPLTPLLQNYVKRNYRFVRLISGSKIYRLKKNKESGAINKSSD